MIGVSFCAVPSVTRCRFVISEDRALLVLAFACVLVAHVVPVGQLFLVDVDFQVIGHRLVTRVIAHIGDCSQAWWRSGRLLGWGRSFGWVSLPAGEDPQATTFARIV